MVERRISAGIGDAVDGFQSGDHEEENHHGQSAVQKGWTSSPGVNEKDGWEGKDDVEDVLNRGCEQEVRNARRLHHVHDVVHHDVHPAELRPHLNRDRKDDSVEHSWLCQGFEGRVASFALKGHRLFDFAVLSQDFWMANVPMAMKVG